MLVVDGNPLDDLTVLQEQGKHLLLIMKNGQLFKNVRRRVGTAPLPEASGICQNWAGRANLRHEEMREFFRLLRRQ